MGRHRLPAASLPPGLIVDQVQMGSGTVAAVAKGKVEAPDCGVNSGRVHRRYVRSVSDLPAHGRCVRIALTGRRFRCATGDCPGAIFAERFGEDSVAPFARRTARLQNIVHHLGLALGGRPGQGLARRLLMPARKDKLLRTLRAQALATRPTPRVIDIDACP